MVDYYQVLNISRSSSLDEIKKAYKKLALKWHPDKNQDNLEEANRRFRELSEAYEVLSDEKKRRVYDQYGKDGLLDRKRQSSSRHYSHGFDDSDDNANMFVFRQPEDVFREFFGGSSPFANLFRDVPRYGSQPVMNFLLPTIAFANLGHVLEGATAGTSGFITGTSTTTTIMNGKKHTTKRIYENGRETILTYENNVLKTKTVNGVPEELGAIKNQRASSKTNKKP